MNFTRLWPRPRALGGRLHLADVPSVRSPAQIASLVRGGVVVAALWAGVALVIGAIVAWRSLEGGTFATSPVILAALVPAATSYGLRLLRWHLLLRTVGGSAPLLASLRVQAIGFALASTPGRLGEPLKFSLLQRHCRLSVGRMGSVLLFERLSDALGLALVAFFGSLFATQWLMAAVDLLRYLWIPAGLVVLALLFARYTGHLSGVLAERSRWLTTRIGDFTAANREILVSPTAAVAVAMTVCARLADAAIVYLVAGSIGVPLSYPQCAVIMGIAGLAGGVSLSPGGLGAAEVTMIGMLIGFGATAGDGLVATIVVRTFTFWLWVGGGLVVLALSWQALMKGDADAHIVGIDTPESAERPDRRVGRPRQGD